MDCCMYFTSSARPTIRCTRPGRGALASTQMLLQQSLRSFNAFLRHPQPSSLRVMSRTASGKFLIYTYAPDRTEEGTFERRMSVRPQHIEGLKANVANGSIRVAGALLTPESLHAAQEDKRMIGSTFIWEAESLEEVREKLSKDPYWTNAVWDKEKIVVTPIAAATPIP
ncbi:hypothetical protein E1B28_009999 [Marasmius oreades]|uniref:YCII-related domain-containing protein n=1 Tax=Marasmius oreades TaxID=181124 RepID=A0A9P7RWW8_9AGAR|nr:uncharacterized protein E1B28_009999 [Marasmius oreades]KAG7090925.1 hypothetical protein E1B28_009999 [Marasmius oreades]